jgi:hypothetical protein
MSARNDTLGRREFIVAAGTAAAVAYLPLAGDAQAAAPAVGAADTRELLADWTIDDMWGVYPRPSEAIGYGRPRGDGADAMLAAVHPADLQFLV